MVVFQHDTMKLDFGAVDWPAQTTFSITFSVMLINHEDYKPASIECCYWFGAGVEYNGGMANWVTDIAFSLAELNTASCSRKKPKFCCIHQHLYEPVQYIALVQMTWTR